NKRLRTSASPVSDSTTAAADYGPARRRQMSASRKKAVAVAKPGKPAKGEILRRAILDAAATLFIERGTGGTSIQDIAESLGLTRTAVYYYFKKKEDIPQALTEDVTILAGRLANNVGARDTLDPITAL